MRFLSERHRQWSILLVALLLLQGCFSRGTVYHNEGMDFGVVKKVAVMPFVNLTRDMTAHDRVRETFNVMLLATGEFYVIPSGEVARVIVSAGVANPNIPSSEEVVRFCKQAKVDAVITGVLKEYGELRSGLTAGNVISLTVQMLEAESGTIVWAADATRGGIKLKDRLIGSSGEPINVITEEALREIIKSLLS